jgi:arginyl-tRNA synthetase
MCPVNNAEDPTIRASRLSLCVLTSNILQLSLSLLGIEVVEKM